MSKYDEAQEFLFPHEFDPTFTSTRGPEDFLTTTQYRDQYCKDSRTKSIKSKYRDADVCHIISEKNGGVNARENYFMGSYSFNRSIGSKADHLNAAIVGLERTTTAVRLSRKFGSYTGERAVDLYNRGVSEFKEFGILMKSKGGYDQRSVAFKNGTARLNKDGYTLDGRSKAARALKERYKNSPF